MKVLSPFPGEIRGGPVDDAQCNVALSDLTGVVEEKVSGWMDWDMCIVPVLQ